MNTHHHNLPDDLREAVISTGIARVKDEQSEKVYLLIDEDRAGELYDHWLRGQLQDGFDEADRGEKAKWDVEEFLTRVHC